MYHIITFPRDFSGHTGHVARESRVDIGFIIFSLNLFNLSKNMNCDLFLSYLIILKFRYSQKATKFERNGRSLAFSEYLNFTMSAKTFSNSYTNITPSCNNFFFLAIQGINFRLQKL